LWEKKRDETMGKEKPRANKRLDNNRSMEKGQQQQTYWKKNAGPGIRDGRRKKPQKKK